MYIIGIIAVIAAAALLSALAVSYGCYRRVFCFDRVRAADPHNVMTGAQYDPFRREMLDMIEKTLAVPYEDVWVTSFDGLKLHGNLYFVDKNAPVQIMFHGYHGNPIRDFSGGIRFALSEGCNVIAVDERAHGKSEGRCLTFGIRERRDVGTWAEFAARKFGPDTPIILVGMSMGAATVLMASSLPLPPGVKAIIADCGYTSPVEIIEKVMRQMKLPPRLLMPFVKLGARLFGRFDLEETGAPEALARTQIPVLLIHGEDDRFVPCEMSVRNHAACGGYSELFTVPNAGHGMAYLLDQEGYVGAEKRFLGRILGAPASPNG